MAIRTGPASFVLLDLVHFIKKNGNNDVSFSMPVAKLFFFVTVEEVYFES